MNSIKAVVGIIGSGLLSSMAFAGEAEDLIALDKATGREVWKTDRSTKWTDIEPGGKIRADGDRGN